MLAELAGILIASWDRSLLSREHLAPAGRSKFLRPEVPSLHADPLPDDVKCGSEVPIRRKQQTLRTVGLDALGAPRG